MYAEIWNMRQALVLTLLQHLMLVRVIPEELDMQWGNCKVAIGLDNDS